MNANENEIAMLNVIDQCRDLGVPAYQLDDMALLAEAGECRIALENLCTQLVEYDVIVSMPVLTLIKVLGITMGIDEEYWTILATSA